MSEAENRAELLRLIQERPELPIIPMVDREVVADDCNAWWMGSWGHSEVTAYYMGRDYVHFKSDDEEEVLGDMVGCKYYETPDGTDITDLTDEEWNALYAAIPWVPCIVVYIETP